MKTRLEIQAKNVIHNLKLFTEISRKQIMFVVKANAYGHGLKEIVEITRNLPFIQYYAVDSLSETLEVKKIAPQKNILVIGWADDLELDELISQGFEFVVPSLDYFSRVKQICKKKSQKARVHLKLDTGTSRLGMRISEILKIFNEGESSNVEVKGLYSHFANIEDTTDHSYARQQLEIFSDLEKKIKQKNLLKHFSCSASALLFPETYYDIVRVGISAYGYWPSKQTYISYIEKNKNNKKIIDLKPVLNWVSKVAQIRTIEKGRYIGYGLTYQTFNRSKMIVIPVGYYDGYDRRLSNLSNILVNGIKAPVRGRVCMNMMMAEVTHMKKVRAGDRVVLIGSAGNEKIDADYLGNLIGTINYEILSRINPLIPRLIVN